MNARYGLSPLTAKFSTARAVWGKAFQSENKILGHVIDPRTGHPADNAMLGAVILPSATETDAFSTALLVGGREALEILMPLRPAMRRSDVRSCIVSISRQNAPEREPMRPWRIP